MSDKELPERVGILETKSEEHDRKHDKHEAFQTRVIMLIIAFGMACALYILDLILTSQGLPST